MSVKEQQPQKATKIGFDDSNYNRFKQIEDELFTLKDDFVRLSDQSIGVNKLDNVKQLLESPSEYLVNKYQELWLSDRPPHLDFTMIFENETKVKVIRLEDLKRKFWTLYKSLGIHAPTINAKAMTSNLNRSSFDMILDESKKDHYNALKGFLDSLNILEKYSAVNSQVNFIRSIPELKFDNLDIVINTTLFKK